MKLKYVLLCGLFVATQTFAQVKMDAGDKLKVFFQVLDQHYTDTISDSAKQKMTDIAIVKMLEELDPHSSYDPQSEVKKADEPLVGNFEGIGVTFQMWKDTILITEVLSGGPSQKIGLQEGDRIVKINDTVVAGVKIVQTDVIKKLRGKKGTQVKVGIVRKSAKNLLDFVITRDRIPMHSIEAAYMASPTTGYIKLTRFSATSVTEFFQVLETLKVEGMQNLILDLQGNGGGYLTTAVKLCNEFLTQPDELIVYTEGAHAKKEEYKTDGKGTVGTGKLIVLIDESSASASEIVSGFIQDSDRGLIVGRRSFGKGLVQFPYYFNDGSRVKLTVAHYYTPSGRCIQRPYVDGKKDYLDEINDRFKDGEVYGADTFHFPDSLLYYTKNKRKVYGGGGIFPDVFVPVDTSLNSEYYQAIRRKGLLNNFCTEYVDLHRDELKKRFATPEDFIANFDSKKEVIDSLFAKADLDSVQRDSAQIARSMPLFVNQTKSLIGRNLFENITFWKINNEMNDSYKKALELMNSDKFAVLNPDKKTIRKAEKEIEKKAQKNSKKK
ncbi:MAG TPA: S41 family peptidase [Chitinophagales bacterium]